MTFAEWKTEFNVLILEKGLQPGCLSDEHQKQMCEEWEWAPADAVDCVVEFQGMIQKTGLPMMELTSAPIPFQAFQVTVAVSETPKAG